MIFSFLLGFLISVLTFKLKNTNGNFYAPEFKEYISAYSGKWLKILTSAALQILPFAAVVFISGTSMIGSVITPLITALRGAELGFIMSYLYVHFSLNGIIFNLLILIPSAVLTSFALVLSGREAFGFSLSLARLAVPDAKSVTLDKDFKIYCMRQLFIMLLYIAGLLLQVIMSLSFFSFFQFKI